MKTKPALIVHGHFYQPPRENPWTGTVDPEPSAAPYHDWNARIHRECYRANAYARIFDDTGAVEAIVNNYRRISFNFGPTLASWLEEHEPASYRRILEADKQSVREHNGHGNAIAQAYNHAILPLLNDRDLRTQIRWGLIDFQQRFGRDAEGMWLPETACDRRTLGALIDERMRFAILAPAQIGRIKEGDKWREASSIDPRRPYRFLHPDGSGRSMALFFYDGPLSRAVAFEGLLLSSRAFVDRCEQASGGPGTVVQAVTDGESYGHHSRHGERCLAHALEIEAPRRGCWITNYGELLDAMPPTQEVDISLGPDGKGSSWSCAHGVGRWYRDCGCHTGGKPGWNQAWRTPLRDALDVLRDAAAEFYQSAAGDLGADPWAMRDDYARVFSDRRADRADFLARHCRRQLGEDERVRALSLLEMQRSAMTIYTSCGWFFNEISGIEGSQVLRYAGRLIDQLRELGAPDPEARMLEVLAQAKSNLPEHGTGADLYRSVCRASRATSPSIAAHISMRRLVGDAVADERAGRFSYQVESERMEESGRMRLSVSHFALTEESTGRCDRLAACAIHFGGIDLHCLVKEFPGEASFSASTERIASALGTTSLLNVLRIAEEELGPNDYGTEHVLPGEREPLSRAIFAETFDRYAALFEAMYRDTHGTMSLFRLAGLPIPRELRAVAELALGHRFQAAIAPLPGDQLDGAVYREAIAIAEQARTFGCKLPDEAARRHLEDALSLHLHRVVSGDGDYEHTGASTPVASVIALLDVAEKLDIELDLERSQELLYDALRDGLTLTPPVRELAAALRVSAKVGRARQSRAT